MRSLTSVISLGAVFVVLFLAPATAKDLSTDKLNYEIAYTEHLLADEMYLQGNLDEAIKHYKSALEVLSGISASQADITLESLELLENDIRYRLMLAEHNEPFWGGAITRHPINPVLAYIQFKTSVEEFSELVKAVKHNIDDLKNTEKETFNNIMEGIGARSEAKVASYQADKAVVRLNRAGDQQGFVRDRMNQIRLRQSLIKLEFENLKQDMQETTDQINGLIVDAVSTSVGLPPLSKTQAALAQDNLEAAIQVTATTLMADKGSPFSEALSSASDQTEKILGYYRDIKKAYDQGREIEQESKRLSALVKTGKIESLVEAGSIVYSHLDDDTRKNLAGLSLPPDNFQKVLDLARKGGSLREEVAIFIQQNTASDEKLLADSLKQLAKDSIQDFSSTVGEVIGHAISVTPSADEMKNLLELSGRLWSGAFVAEIFPTEAVEALVKDLGVHCSDLSLCRNILSKKISQLGLPNLPGVTVADGELQVATANSRRFSLPLREVTAKLAKRQIDLTREQAVGEVDRLLSGLSGLRTSMTFEIVKRLPDASFKPAIQTMLDSLQLPANTSLVEAFFKKNTGKALQLYKENAAAFQIGLVVMGKDDQSTRYLAPGQQEPGQPNNDAPQSALAHQALMAAGPWGVAADFAIRILAGFGKMDDLANRMAKLDEEDKQLTVEILHLYEIQREADFSASLAALDQKIADTKQVAALQRQDFLGGAVVKAGQEQADTVSKIRLAMPLVYLSTELLRMRFDMLDRALAHWTVGNPSAPRYRTMIESLIRNDPNWLRYAIDSEINVYEWFNRDVEGQRRDLAKMEAHWQKLFKLATEVCHVKGCTQEQAVVGEISLTQEIPLRSLLSADQLRSFEKWLKNENSTVFQAAFLLRPENVPLVRDLNNVRVVDVSVGGKGASGDGRLLLEGARLGHSGLGWVRIGNRYFTESLDPANSPFLPPMTEKKAAHHARTLRGRWAASKTLALEKLDGYSLYGLWSISLQRENDTSQLKDVMLRFFVQYSEPPADQKGAYFSDIDQTYEMKCSKSHRDHKIPISALSLLMVPSEARPGYATPGWSDHADDECRLEEALAVVQE